MKVIILNIVGASIIVGLLFIPMMEQSKAKDVAPVMYKFEPQIERPSETGGIDLDRAFDKELTAPRENEVKEPVIVQVINAVSDNFSKFMAGILALSQALLNFKAYKTRQRKKAKI